MNYWATWCPPCLEEIPELVSFHESHKDHDAVVLGVNLEDINQTELKDFVNDYFVTYPVFPHEPAAKAELGPVPGLPTTYIISPEGTVMARQVGGITEAMLNEYLEGQSKVRHSFLHNTAQHSP